MDEGSVENNQYYPLMFPSGMPVKQEREESLSHAFCHHTTSLPQDSSLSTDPLGSIKITNVCGSLSKDFYEELSDNQINNHFLQLPLMTEETVPKDEEAPVRHVTFEATLPLYQLSNQMRTVSFQSQAIEKRAAQAVYHPLSNNNGGHRPQEPQQDPQLLIHVPMSNPDANSYSCPTRCPCVCHVPCTTMPSNSAAFDEENQRPCVIMAPINHGNEAPSIVTHVPLQIGGHLFKPWGISTEWEANEMNEDSGPDSDREEKYFRKALNGKLARFKLAKEDWDKIPIKTFPSGGRLLGGDWTRIFSIKVKKSNPWCNLRFKNNHVRSANSRKMHSAPFFRGAGECKLPECQVKMAFVIHEERGKYVDVKYIGNICHKVKN